MPYLEAFRQSLALFICVVLPSSLLSSIRLQKRCQNFTQLFIARYELPCAEGICVRYHPQVNTEGSVLPDPCLNGGRLPRRPQPVFSSAFPSGPGHEDLFLIWKSALCSVCTPIRCSCTRVRLQLFNQSPWLTLGQIQRVF